MFQWTQRIKDHIQEIISFVGLITGYGIAVTGQSPTPWPQTTAVLIVIVSTLFLWWQWWPRISRQSNLLLPGSTDGQISGLESLFEPFRTSSRRSYALSLTRRRVEGAILSALTLGALALSSFRLSAVAVEIFPSTLPIPMTCVGDGSSHALRIVIAEFNKVGNSPLLEDRLFDLLTDHSKWMGRVHVCRTDTVVKNQSEAIELGKQALAAIVVWGRSDPALYEVNLQIAEWDLRSVNFRSFPTPEAMTPEFQLREPLRTSFLTEFILSDLFFLHGETLAARELLDAALRSAHDVGLDQEPQNAEDFAIAYFLLGYYYDEPASTRPDLRLAIKYYSRAIEVDNTFYRTYINLGKAYENNEQPELAVETYQTCAALAEDSEPSFAAAALINLAWLYASADQPLAEDYFAQAILLDPFEGYTQRGLARSGIWRQMGPAIEDFSKALEINNTDPYLYDALGRTQLLDDQPEEALRTYQKAIAAADWQPGDKDILIDNLRAMGKDPTPNQVVTLIINELESADLP